MEGEHSIELKPWPVASLLFLNVCFACRHVCAVHIFSVCRGLERVSDPWDLSSYDYELLYGCWESNLDPEFMVHAGLLMKMSGVEKPDTGLKSMARAACWSWPFQKRR